MVEKSPRDTLYDTTGRPLREHGAGVPRSLATDSGGDSETIKQYQYGAQGAERPVVGLRVL